MKFGDLSLNSKLPIGPQKFSVFCCRTLYLHGIQQYCNAYSIGDTIFEGMLLEVTTQGHYGTYSGLDIVLNQGCEKINCT